MSKCERVESRFCVSFSRGTVIALDSDSLKVGEDVTDRFDHCQTF